MLPTTRILHLTLAKNRYLGFSNIISGTLNYDNRRIGRAKFKEEGLWLLYYYPNKTSPGGMVPLGYCIETETIVHWKKQDSYFLKIIAKSTKKEQQARHFS